MSLIDTPEKNLTLTFSLLENYFSSVPEITESPMINMVSFSHSCKTDLFGDAMVSVRLLYLRESVRFCEKFGFREID